MKVDWDKVKQDAELKEDHQVKEELMTQRIVKYIILGLVALALVVGLGCFWYYNDSLKAVNNQKTETMQVTIPIGSSSKDIARLLGVQPQVVGRRAAGAQGPALQQLRLVGRAGTVGPDLQVQGLAGFRIPV